MFRPVVQIYNRARFRAGLWGSRRRAYVALIGVAVVASGTALSATSAVAKSKPIFALITINGSQSFFVDQDNGAKQEAAKLGATIRVFNVNSSSSATISDVQTAIAQGAAGLIVAPPSNSLGPRIVSLAKAAHIPVLAIDNNFDGPGKKPVPLVGLNAPAVGKNSGELLSNLYKKSHWSASSTYYLSVELPGLQTCTLRTNAEKSEFLKADPGFPKSHIIVVPYDGTVEKALSAVGPVAVSHPQVQHWLVASCNDDGVVGAGKGLINSHVSVSNIDGAGLGGDLACTAWGNGAAPSGLLASNYFAPQTFGADAVKAMYANVVHGKKLPANVYVSIVDVTPKTYKRYVKC